MEPFSITCHSCAARLKVARPELIDQTLACPKCGSMINVQHPTGWKPPIPESKGSLSALSSVVSGNDFDQIEDLLPKPGQKVRISPSTGAKTTGTPTPQQPDKPRFQNPVPPTNAGPNQTGNPAQDQPILPGQQWSNPSTQQRKKLMLMIGSAVATVLLVAIAITTIVRLGGETSDPDNDQIAAGDSTEPSDDLSTPPTTDSSTTSDPATEPEKQNGGGFLEDTPTTSQLPIEQNTNCLLYTSPSPRDLSTSRMPSSA